MPIFERVLVHLKIIGLCTVEGDGWGEAPPCDGVFVLASFHGKFPHLLNWTSAMGKSVKKSAKGRLDKYYKLAK